MSKSRKVLLGHHGLALIRHAVAIVLGEARAEAQAKAEITATEARLAGAMRKPPHQAAALGSGPTRHVRPTLATSRRALARTAAMSRGQLGSKPMPCLTRIVPAPVADPVARRVVDSIGEFVVADTPLGSLGVDMPRPRKVPMERRLV